MNYGAIIIENRIDVSAIIEDHKKFLPEYFEVKHLVHGGIKSILDYNNLLASLPFWMALPYDKVLIFQHDSGLLRHGIEEFYEWDYVGAPWKFQEHGGNGGLSWRSKDAMIEVLKRFNYVPSGNNNEDIYFSNALKQMPDFKLAPREVCEKFSCETIYKEGTLGYHAIDKYLTKEEVSKIKNQYE